MNEHLISVNNYKKPKIVSGAKGNYYIILRLLLMEPGTNPLFPLMGCGLRSKALFITKDQVQDLQVDISKQIETYLPSLLATDVQLSVDDDNNLKISISSESEEYDFSSNDFYMDMDKIVEEVYSEQ